MKAFAGPCKLASTALLALSFMANAAAQSYPNHTVRIVVPFPGGSVVDTYTRLLGEAMRPVLGDAPVLVEPRPGAGTEIGTKYVISQPADGYTLLMATSSLAIKSAQFKPPFDARKDFVGVGLLTDSPLFLVCNSTLPFKTAKDVVEYAKANPNKLNLVNYGVGTLGHLTGELLMYKAGAKAVPIAFNGSVNAALAVSQGNGDCGFNVLTSFSAFIQQGRVKVLAASSVKRDPLNPDVPGMAESGITGVDVSSWGGVVAPTGTPRDAVQKLNAALDVAMKAPAVRAHFKNVGLGLEQGVSTPEQFTQQINSNVDDFYKLIRAANLQFD